MSDEPDGVTSISDDACDGAARQIMAAIEGLAILRQMTGHFDSRVIDVMCQTASPEAADMLIKLAGLLVNQQIGMGRASYTQWLLTGYTHAESRLIAELTGHADWPDGQQRSDVIRAWILDSMAHSDPMVTRVHELGVEQFGVGIVEVFNRSWDEYWQHLQQRCGSWSTSTTTRQYAVRLTWKNGETELHPRTVDGVSRFEAERLHSQALMSSNVGDDLARPAIITRVTTSGPWHAV